MNDTTYVLTLVLTKVVECLQPDQAREAAEKVRGLIDPDDPIPKRTFIEETAASLAEYADRREGEKARVG